MRAARGFALAAGVILTGVLSTIAAGPVRAQCANCGARPTHVELAGGLICFRGDGSPLSDLCISTWEASTVIECASSGNPRVPFTVNTGTQNPGPGYVRLYEDLPEGGQRLIVETAFSSRGFAWPATTNIVVEPEEIGFRDGGEACACHTRAADPATACGGVR